MIEEKVVSQESEHEQEVKELFKKLTVEISGTSLRAISYDGFKIAIDQMMNKAYYMGTQQGFDTVEAVLGKVFNR